jgi:putative transposase
VRYEFQECIEGLHEASRGVYGAPRIHAELRIEHGIHISRKHVERLMRRAGLQGVHRRRQGRSKAQRASLEARVAPDKVQRGFDIEQVDSVWFAGVTQHPTSGACLYLAAVLDATSKRFVGWSRSESPCTELVVNAVSRRSPCSLDSDGLERFLAE